MILGHFLFITSLATAGEGGMIVVNLKTLRYFKIIRAHGWDREIKKKKLGILILLMRVLILDH